MGGIKTLKIQLTLNASVEADNAIIEYIEKHGKRSGIPKHLLMLGFESLVNIGSNSKTATIEPKSEPKQVSKPNLNQYMS